MLSKILQEINDLHGERISCLKQFQLIEAVSQTQKSDTRE